MAPYWHSEQHGLTIYLGDCLDVLSALPAGIAQCCVTSPPYWGLRDYGTAEWECGDPECDHARRAQISGSKTDTNAGALRDKPVGVCRKCGAVRVDRQLGLEHTPDQYVARMVEVFRGVRRVLRDDGTCWLNLGDSYARNPGKGVKFEGDNGLENRQAIEGNRGPEVPHGLKEKDLCGIPWRVAFALQADGWWLRSDCIWAKANPMPESVTDRPTSAHEHVFLLAAAQRYYYDQEAVREPHSPLTVKVHSGYRETRPHSVSDQSREANTSGRSRNDTDSLKNGPGTLNPSGRNLRNVWQVNTQPFPEAHFATFPPKLIEPCIRAGSAARACSECGKPWTMHMGQSGEYDVLLPSCPCGIEHPIPQEELDADPTLLDDFELEIPEPIPSIVLDPFLGSGTTLLVAYQQGRRGIGIELNEQYAEMAVKWLEREIAQGRLFEPGEIAPRPVQTTLEVGG